MISCEHFIYGLNTKKGIILHKSPNLGTIIDDKTLYFLEHVGDTVSESRDYQIWLPKNGLFAVSRVHPVTDEYGRRGVWNHTILMTIRDAQHLILTHLTPHFITHLNHEAPLTPITIEE